jgi:hypothetical protein
MDATIAGVDPSQLLDSGPFHREAQKFISTVIADARLKKSASQLSA